MLKYKNKQTKLIKWYFFYHLIFYSNCLFYNFIMSTLSYIFCCIWELGWERGKASHECQLDLAIISNFHLQNLQLAKLVEHCASRRVSKECCSMPGAVKILITFVIVPNINTSFTWTISELQKTCPEYLRIQKFVLMFEGRMNFPSTCLCVWCYSSGLTVWAFIWCSVCILRVLLLILSDIPGLAVILQDKFDRLHSTQHVIICKRKAY